MQKIHIPVLVKEILDLLNLKRGDMAIDATLDGGGHAKEILKIISPEGKLLGIEQDPDMINYLTDEIKESGEDCWKSLSIECGNFKNIEDIARKNNFTEIRAILYDLGMSTFHLKESGRGFSFEQGQEPILMSMGKNAEKTASHILNSYKKDDLKIIFIEYGEFKASFANKMAGKIVEARKNKKIISVNDLLNTVEIRDKKVLARIFQALRIEVNDEMNALKESLKKAFEIISPGGKIAVISYQSLEDRIVKNFFREKKNLKLSETLTKKPITASEEEILSNPSARSAKLRVLTKI